MEKGRYKIFITTSMAHTNINFSIEIEQDETLPFVDVLKDKNR
jgi:hypothetical protein